MAKRSYLKTAEVAHLFEVSPSTIIRWTRDGHLNAARTPGERGRYRFDPIEINAAAAYFREHGQFEPVAS